MVSKTTMKVTNLNNTHVLFLYNQSTKQLESYDNDKNTGCRIMSIKLKDINTPYKMWIRYIKAVEDDGEKTTHRFVLWFLDVDLVTDNLRLCCMNSEQKRRNFELPVNTHPTDVWFDGKYMCIQFFKNDKSLRPVQMCDDEKWEDFGLISILIGNQEDYSLDSIVVPILVESCIFQSYSPHIFIIKIDKYYYICRLLPNSVNNKVMSLNISKIGQAGAIEYTHKDLMDVSTNARLIQVAYLIESKQLVFSIFEMSRKCWVNGRTVYDMRSYATRLKSKEDGDTSKLIHSMKERKGMGSFSTLKQGTFNEWKLKSVEKPFKDNENLYVVSKDQSTMYYDRNHVYLWYEETLVDDFYGVLCFEAPKISLSALNKFKEQSTTTNHRCQTDCEADSQSKTSDIIDVCDESHDTNLVNRNTLKKAIKGKKPIVSMRSESYKIKNKNLILEEIEHLQRQNVSTNKQLQHITKDNYNDSIVLSAHIIINSITKRPRFFMLFKHLGCTALGEMITDQNNLGVDTLILLQETSGYYTVHVTENSLYLLHYPSSSSIYSYTPQIICIYE